MFLIYENIVLVVVAGAVMVLLNDFETIVTFQFAGFLIDLYQVKLVTRNKQIHLFNETS